MPLFFQIHSYTNFNIIHTHTHSFSMATLLIYCVNSPFYRCICAYHELDFIKKWQIITIMMCVPHLFSHFIALNPGYQDHCFELCVAIRFYLLYLMMKSGAVYNIEMIQYEAKLLNLCT